MRIASLSPATTEILFRLEQGKHVVCVDRFSDVPEQAAALPRLQGHGKIDIEALRSFQPEIVFTGAGIQTKIGDTLKSAGIAVIHQAPKSLADVYVSIREIGMLLGCEARAQALEQTMRQECNDVHRKAGMLPRKPKVYVEEWSDPPMVSGNWVPDIVMCAGGLSFPLPAGSPSREVTLEEVRTFDPDLIVLSICGAGLNASRDVLLSRSGWSALRAAQEGHVFVIDDSLLNRPGPRLPEGARRLFGWMFQSLH